MSDMYFVPFRPAYDSAGISVPGSQHYFTVSDGGAGGETPSAPYLDAGMTIPASNPVVADAAGKIPAIYLDEAVSYRVRIYDRNAEVGVDTPLEEYAPYIPGTAGIEADVGLRSDLAADTGFTIIKRKIAGTGTYARSAADWARFGTEASDFSILNWIDPAQDDDVLDGTIATDQSTSFSNAKTDIAARTGQKGLILPTGATFRHDSQLTLDIPDLKLLGNWARIVSAKSDTNPLILLSADGTDIEKLDTLLDAAVTTTHHYRVTGKNCRLRHWRQDYATYQDTPAFYVRGGDGFQCFDGYVRGSNAWAGFVEGSDLLFQAINAESEGGGDDFFAIKAILQNSENIRLIGCKIKGFASICSIGSQVGVVTVDDPTRSRAVRGVEVLSNEAEECGTLMDIRPGGTDSGSGDYHSGIVEVVNLSHNSLTDIAGVAFQNGMEIQAGKGAIVRYITGVGNGILARAASTGGTESGHLGVVNTTLLPTPQIYGIDPEIKYVDPFSGAAHGATITAEGSTGPDPYDGYAVGDTVPGHPVDNIVRIDPAAATMPAGAITLRGSGNGSATNGILVLSGGDDIVWLGDFELDNINATNNANGAGVRALSRVQVVSDRIRISRTNKNHTNTALLPYRCDSGSTGDIICNHVERVHLAESLAAATDKTKVAFKAPRNAFVAKVDFVNGSAVAANDTDFRTFNVNDPDNGATNFAAVNTKVTGGAALVADTAVTIVKARDLSAANELRLCFDKDERLKVGITHGGAGQALTDAQAIIHWAPY